MSSFSKIDSSESADDNKSKPSATLALVLCVRNHKGLTWTINQKAIIRVSEI